MNEAEKKTQVTEPPLKTRRVLKSGNDGQRFRREAWPREERSKSINTELPPGYRRDGEHLLARMPATPRTASPVPHLTSLHASDGHGQYGSATFRGNCSGLLIRDLLLYFQPKLVLDPMSGSGTCRDVCQELEIPCVSFDLAQGLDACDEANYQRLAGYDFVWIHPPYWKLIEYGHDPRCLSQASTLDDFVMRLRQVFRNCKSVLSPAGKIVVLIGDGRERGEYWGLPYRTLQAADAEGLWLAAPEIIRFGHGSTSSRKEYTSAFIPLLHDVCWVLKTVINVEKRL
jgi:hypothetical protein